MSSRQLPDDLKSMTPHLCQLQVLSLTYPKSTIQVKSDYLRALAVLVENLPALHSFTFYAPGGSRDVTAGDGGNDDIDDDDTGEQEIIQSLSASYERSAHAESIPMSGPALSTPFLQRLLTTRGKDLRMLRLHGIGMSLQQFATICSLCGGPESQLSDLVVHLYEYDHGAARLSEAVNNLSKLKSLHIMSSANSDMILSDEDLRTIADACSSTLQQIGFRNRVWLVSPGHSSMFQA
jgi:hypothetical protein